MLLLLLLLLLLPLLLLLLLLLLLCLSLSPLIEVLRACRARDEAVVGLSRKSFLACRGFRFLSTNSPEVGGLLPCKLRLPNMQPAWAARGPAAE